MLESRTQLPKLFRQDCASDTVLGQVAKYTEPVKLGESEKVFLFVSGKAGRAKLQSKVTKHLGRNSPILCSWEDVLTP